MRAIVHIGFHKTGTTSIQAFLDASRDRLRECGISFFNGQHIPSNHVELHACTMRDERMTPFKMSLGEPLSSSYRSAVADRIDRFKREAETETLLFSAEGLSYLRYEDELARLRDLIGLRDISIIAYLREPTRWLVSYSEEMRKHHFPKTIDRDSFAYVKPDSWLIDYAARLAPFKREFGDVMLLDYDESCLAYGGVIPSFLRALGVAQAFDSNQGSKYRLNVRLAAN